MNKYLEKLATYIEPRNRYKSKSVNQYSKNGKKWPLVEPGTESDEEMEDWERSGRPVRK
jgi:hypothetical protein